MTDHETNGRWSDQILAPGFSSNAAWDARDDAAPATPRDGVYAVHGALLHTGQVMLFSGRLEGRTRPARNLYAAWLWTPGDPGPPGTFANLAASRSFTDDAETVPFNNTDPAEPSDWIDADGAVTPAFVPGLDLFCAHHAFLDDGKLLVVGGASAKEPGDAWGLDAVYTFDPDAPPATAPGAFRNAWQKHDNMALGRWYPTSVTLPDGRCAIFSGRPKRPQDKDRDGNDEGGINPRVEVVGPPDYAPVDLGPSADRDLYIYPGLHLVPGGKIFYTSTSWAQGASRPNTAAFRMTDTYDGAWQDWPHPTIPGDKLRPNFHERQEGMSVVVSPASAGKILLVGGSRRAPNVQTVDAAGNLKWKATTGDIFVWTDPTTGDVVRVADGDGNDLTGTGTLGATHDHEAELVGGTGDLAGVTNVEAQTEYGGITPQSSPSSIELLHTRGEPGTGSTDPVWEIAGSLQVGPKPGGDPGVGRANVNVVLLPDGKVCVVGGKYDHKNAPNGAVLAAELVDPDTGTSQVVASMAVRRGYHSVALLLPDGRVMVAGDGRTIQFYEPPYLHKDTAVPRVRIEGLSVPDAPERHAHYGGTIEVEVDDASPVTQVVLMRPGSVTHHTDPGQRLEPCLFTKQFAADGNDTLQVQVPLDAGALPPGYYMLFVLDGLGRPCERAAFVRISHRRCRLITHRNVFGRDEVAAAMAGPDAGRIPEALYLQVDGFLPGELGIGTSLPTGTAISALDVSVDFVETSSGISIVPNRIEPEDPTLDPRIRQRFTFVYDVVFSSLTSFPVAGPSGSDVLERELLAEVAPDDTGTGHRCRGEIRLTDQPNPYMLDGSTHWLSVDLRVFRVKDDQTFLGAEVDDDPLGYIETVTENLELAAHDFDTELETEQDQSRLNPASHEDGQKVWNFAVAQVRYRGSVDNDAVGVRCFFRMFQTAVAGLAYDPSSTYPSVTGPDGGPVPLLGQVDGKLASIPFFAKPREANMAAQPVTVKTLDGTGAESVKYFGCWLDVNHGEERFVEQFAPGATGPFTATGTQPLETIGQLVNRGAHQCLVAEIAFGTDLLQAGDTPAGSDKLAQRNLAWLDADNPGTATSRVVAHTFDLLPPSARQRRRGGLERRVADMHLTATDGVIAKALPEFAYDELMISWSELPAGSSVDLYLPDGALQQMLALHQLRYGPQQIHHVDAHTLRLQARGTTHLPVLWPKPEAVAGLMTLTLPDGITAGEHYRVVAHQVDGRARKIVGSFELAIPVAKAAQLAGPAANTYSVLAHVLGRMSTSNRWYPVMSRYVDQLAARLTGLGIDATTVEPSPAGTGLTLGYADGKPLRPGATEPDPGGPTDPTDPGGPGGGDNPTRPGSGGKRVTTGHVCQIVYDCHGAFEGFTVDTCDGPRGFRTRASGIERLVRRACRDGLAVTVFERGRPPRIVKIVLGCD